MNSAISCVRVARSGHVLTWPARDDGVCYTADVPIELAQVVGVLLLLCTVVLAILIVWRIVRWLVSRSFGNL
jgi:hypothetical protein